jgi:hypothetical protein
VAGIDSEKDSRSGESVASVFPSLTTSFDRVRLGPANKSRSVSPEHKKSTKLIPLRLQVSQRLKRTRYSRNPFSVVTPLMMSRHSRRSWAVRLLAVCSGLAGAPRVERSSSIGREIRPSVEGPIYRPSIAKSLATVDSALPFAERTNLSVTAHVPARCRRSSKMRIDAEHPLLFGLDNLPSHQAKSSQSCISKR